MLPSVEAITLVLPDLLALPVLPRSTPSQSVLPSTRMSTLRAIVSALPCGCYVRCLAAVVALSRAMRGCCISGARLCVPHRPAFQAVGEPSVPVSSADDRLARALRRLAILERDKRHTRRAYPT